MYNSSKSFTYIEKRIGPQIVPGGIPYLTYSESLICSLILNDCDLLLKYDLNQDRNLFIPRYYKF